MTNASFRTLTRWSGSRTLFPPIIHSWQQNTRSLPLASISPAQCRNIRIFLPFRFYVKSTLLKHKRHMYRIVKLTVLTLWICRNLISRKIWEAEKISVRPIPINRPINRWKTADLIGRLYRQTHRYNRSPKITKKPQKLRIFT